MALRITRINPRTGRVERPWRNREGQFVLADPAHGAQRHHDKFAVKVDTVEEMAALVARGFPVRMTDGESPPSLISPDSLTLEEVEGTDPATFYAEMAPKPPFEKAEMMEELKQALLVQANQIAHAGGLTYALSFMGFETKNTTYPYVEDDLRKVDLRRFNATHYLDQAYDYAFQVGLDQRFDDAVAQDVREFVLGANSLASNGEASPLSDPGGLCRRAADTAFGRWRLEEGDNLSTRELALLAQMTEPAVRNSLSKERIPVGKTGVDNAAARAWLRTRRDFVATRSPEITIENRGDWARFLLDREEFGYAFRAILATHSANAQELAGKARVKEPFLRALLAGNPPADVERLQRVGQALGLDVPHFVGIAIKAALRPGEG